MEKHLSFDAAISFAGEQRTLAKSIANQLTPLGYSIFYDAYNVSETWGRDISEIFHGIYSRTPCILIIATKEYVEVDIRRQWLDYFADHSALLDSKADKQRTRL
jgi:hypothetical protein